MSQVVIPRNADVIKTLTFSTDTSAYASGDLVADSQAITTATNGYGGIVTLDSLTVTDGADQKGILYFVFLNASTSLGTENSAPDISDANVAAAVLGVVAVVAADYVDVGGAAVATKSNINLMLQSASTTDSLWVGLVGGTTTPTYAADSLKVRLGFRRSEQ